MAKTSKRSPCMRTWEICSRGQRSFIKLQRSIVYLLSLIRAFRRVWNHMQSPAQKSMEPSLSLNFTFFFFSLSGPTVHSGSYGFGFCLWFWGLRRRKRLPRGPATTKAALPVQPVRSWCSFHTRGPKILVYAPPQPLLVDKAGII